MQRFFSALSIAVALLADTEVNAQARMACDRSKFRTVLDVGHTRTAPGATSARGVKEFEFNRQLAEAVREALVAKGFATSASRTASASCRLNSNSFTPRALVAPGAVRV